MSRNLRYWRRIFWCGAAALALHFALTLRAQVPVYSYNQYWSVNGWNTTPYLPETQLQISNLNNLVSLWWSDSITNAAVIQTTTNFSPGSEWTTLPNQPVELAMYSGSGVSYPHLMTLSPPLDEQYFRLTGVGTVSLPIFQFAIFHNDQLEFTQGPPLNIGGRTHANGPICLGAASGNILRFTETVTTASSIVYSNMGGYSGFSAPVYEGSPTNRTGTPILRVPIGTNNTPAAMREIINLPPAGESPTSALGQQRYYNKAGVVLLVSNTSVNLIVKDLGAASGTTYSYDYTSNSPSLVQQSNLNHFLPFVSLTNRFRDFREASKWVEPTEIDMGKLKTWLTTNSAILTRFPAGSGVYPKIMYVADFRTLTNIHAVRVMNGAIVPTNGPAHATAEGFTLATINPLYVWGNYNCPNAAHLGTTNTTATFPASLICDAITVLSPNWKDSAYSTNALSLRQAADTTINAAIIAGTVYTTRTGAGYWSGGIQNTTRLLENWSGSTLTLNTSFVVLYSSARATNQFQNPGIYYNAPTRNFNFNTNYLMETKLPPGTPVVFGITPAN